MKLLYIHQYYAFPSIHSSTRSYDIANALSKKGIDVTVITTITKVKGLDESKRWNYFEKEDIKYWVLNSLYSQQQSFSKRIMSFISFMFFATIKSLQIKTDVVLATSTPITVAIPALVKRVFSNTPFIFEVRDVWPEVPVKMGLIKNKIIISVLYWFEKHIYKRASFIIPLSTDMESSIKKRYELNNTVVIPNISEINRFQNEIVPYELPFAHLIGKSKIILYAGAFGAVNGISYVIDLAEKTLQIDHNIIYVLIGVGHQKEKIRKMAVEKQLLNKSVFILEPVPKNALPYLYSIATLGSSFVINNKVLWDNSANKFFDTLAAGKPILINHGGWQADIIKNEGIGYVLSPTINNNDVVEFCVYINNSNVIRKQGENALTIAKRYYSLEVSSQKYFDIIDNILKNQTDNNLL